MSDTTATLPLSKGYLVVDQKKCSGCMSCMIACSLAHEGEVNLSHARLQIKKNPFGVFPKTDVDLFFCRQCENAPCVDACPNGSLAPDPETGVRVINEETCIGCGRCAKACPYAPTRIIMDRTIRKALKCDLCQNTPFWDEVGGVLGQHACVYVCPLTAIRYTTEIPEQTDAGYYLNFRTSPHYARANLPSSDDGLQPPMEAQAAFGIPITGSGVTRSFWDDPEIEEA